MANGVAGELAKCWVSVAWDVRPGDYVERAGGLRLVRAVQATGRDAPYFQVDDYPELIESFRDAAGKAWVSWQTCGRVALVR